MTVDDFRRIALGFPAAEERTHMNHPDFRVNGRIFATLPKPDGPHGMLKLTPEQQQTYVAAHPEAFTPVPGGWGRQGCTLVVLAKAKAQPVKAAMGEAWKAASEKIPATRKKK